MGLGMQLVAWHPDFVAMLVARRGFRVIRFDNRKVRPGASASTQLGVPNLALDSLRFAVGMKGRRAPTR